MTAWNDGKPLGVPYYGNKSVREFIKRGDKAKRLALIRRRHRAWLRQQAAGEAPLEDESTGGDSMDGFFD